MKQNILIWAFFVSIIPNAQSQNDLQKNIFDYLKNDALIFSGKELVRGAQDTREFISDFYETNGKKSTYKKNFSIEVNANLEYETGEIQTNSGSFPVMFIRSKADPTRPKIELMVINEEKDPVNETANLDRQRSRWMELCNTHKASELVSRLYTSDAYYYNRGRLIQGTKALSAEYSYMNNEAYSLNLTPKHVVFVTPNLAYEIGRCSGSYPYPYMLLWEKQTDGDWQIMMDSNF